MDDYGWDLWWKVERDICFLYYELAQHAGVTGDLAYGLIYNLPYWEFLNLRDPSMSEGESRFIRDGCLVMVLAMAWDIIDGSGSELKGKFGFWREAVAELEAEDVRTEKLIQIINLALDIAEQGHSRNKELEDRNVSVSFRQLV